MDISLKTKQIVVIGLGASRVLKELRKIVVETHGDNLAAVQSILEDSGFELTVIPYELNSYVIGTKPTLT